MKLHLYIRRMSLSCPFIALLLALAACSIPIVEPQDTAVTMQSTAELANPASTNCVEQGGKLIIEERGDGGQFGVCYFLDNRQCEEWALLRGDCPVGGLKVTGYITDAARYCAITGGTYTITGNSAAEDEQGTCTFKDGSQCDVWEYYNGACVPENSTPTATLEEATPPAQTIEESLQEGAALTARMLVAPDALMGPSPSSFNWSPVRARLTYVEPVDGQDMLWLYDAASGEKRALFDPSEHADNIDVSSAQWSPNGARLLLAGEDALWLLDVKTGATYALLEDGRAKTGILFTPDGKRVSYVQDNDLYTIDLVGGQVERLTSDGGETVFNGALDWVYNEELATRAAQPGYGWSPDGNWLIYLRLDETAVPNDPVTDYRPVPATVSYTRYPTAGTANPVATLHALTPGALAPPLEVPLPAGTEYVLPLFTWTPDSNHALYITVNRDHTELALNMWTPQSGETRTLISETDPNWINEERYVPPVFLEDGKHFLWLSERDGFMHLYLYTIEGELVRQLTQGEWMIDSTAWNLLTPGRPVHVDPSETWAYFIATKNSPLERQIYRLNINNGQLEQISEEQGFHFAALSADGAYLVEQFSAVDTPPITRVVSTEDSTAAVLAESAGPAVPLPALTREFVTIKAHDGVDLYGQLVKPANFDPTVKYPVVVHWYGGPGLQMVSNRYGATNIFNIIERDVLYTQAGFLVWRLDNRGAVGRGHAFETPIFGQLGQAALDDQLAGIEYLATLPYIDTVHIGTDGKSFGGYMTLYALIHAPDVFRCGVAGAAPTDWSYYDTIYTERYMRTPEQNPDGYAATNLIAKAESLEAAPLLVHGLADTNVHLQNTVNFIEALETADKSFEFVPLPNLSHSIHGDGLVAMLSASEAYFTRCFADIEDMEKQGGEPADSAAVDAATKAETAEVAEAAGEGEPAASEATLQMENVPLAEALDALQPQDVFTNFYNITQVPRPSGEMEQIQAFLVAFGEGLGLETIADEAGNVIIRKPAADGLENRAGVVLQAHMDMVPQKSNEKVFDFATDPIQAIVNGDYIVADETTLGADDGIGMAMIMGVLQSESLQAGPIEGLFTVNEETDMSGINGLAPGLLQGTTLINLDSEEEGTFTIGSAGGEHAGVTFSYAQVPVPAEMVSYEIKVEGLLGGHSGVDINLGRGHAIKILARLLKEAAEPFDLRVATLSGGTAANAIPREATALVVLPAEQVEPFLSFAEEFEAKVRSELQAVEPDLRVEVTEAEAPQQIMEESIQPVVINALYATPQGVLRMSDAVPGLVETSNNLGVINASDGQMEVVCTPRSSVDSALVDTGQMIASVWELAGQTVEFSGAYGAWRPDPHSPILGLMSEVYEDLYGQQPEVSAVHAGLECGVVASSYPDMDMISIGPTIENVHSPSERLYIPSVAKTMDLLTKTLEKMPAAEG